MPWTYAIASSDSHCPGVLSDHLYELTTQAALTTATHLLHTHTHLLDFSHTLQQSYTVSQDFLQLFTIKP